MAQGKKRKYRVLASVSGSIEMVIMAESKEDAERRLHLAADTGHVRLGTGMGLEITSIEELSPRRRREGSVASERPEIHGKWHRNFEGEWCVKVGPDLPPLEEGTTVIVDGEEVGAGTLEYVDGEYAYYRLAPAGRKRRVSCRPPG
jgi:hypothetical protein